MSTAQSITAIEQDIDFLPAHYREQTAHRKGRAWRLSTIILLAMLLPVASFYQMRVRFTLQKQLDELRPQCALIDANRAQLQALELKRQDGQSAARLVAYLHHPWPRSQVLSALLPNLPESVTLTSIQIEEIAGSAAVAIPATRNLHQEAVAQTPELPPAEADAKSLRDRHDNAQVVVLLSGLATDPAELHEYLGHLSHHRLFVKTELMSLESPASKGPIAGKVEGSQFRARLILAQCSGQPEGQKIKSGSVAQQAASEVLARSAP